jgi:hypothetical protein
MKRKRIGRSDYVTLSTRIAVLGEWLRELERAVGHLQALSMQGAGVESVLSDRVVILDDELMEVV